MKIKFEGLKGFHEKSGWIDLNQITVFTGKNSSGKSSAIQLLRIFSEHYYNCDSNWEDFLSTPIDLDKAGGEEKLRNFLEQTSIGFINEKYVCLNPGWVLNGYLRNKAVNDALKEFCKPIDETGISDIFKSEEVKQEISHSETLQEIRRKISKKFDLSIIEANRMVQGYLGSLSDRAKTTEYIDADLKVAEIANSNIPWGHIDELSIIELLNKEIYNDEESQPDISINAFLSEHLPEIDSIQLLRECIQARSLFWKTLSIY